MRAGIVRYDETTRLPDELREQLQRHFDVVLGLLLLATPRSIDTALARLEEASGHTWSAGERDDHRLQLLEMRSLQLQRLAAYRDRGQFPLNEGQAIDAVPIFADRHDTACAVGHLMRMSGWERAVAKIQQTNNLVYVPDAFHSAVARWVLTSGLTLEEAALIQPAYGGFYTPYLPGTFTSNGLKYENFLISSATYDGSWVNSTNEFHSSLKNFCGMEDNFECSVIGNGPTFLTNVGLNAGEGFLYGYFSDRFDPIGTHWITIGGYSGGVGLGTPRLINARSPGTTLQKVVVTFDVSTLDPGATITQIAEHSYPPYGGFDGTFEAGPQPRFEFRTAASPGASTGTFLKEDTTLPCCFQPQSASATLTAPTDHFRVTTTVWLNNRATLDAFVVGFNVVPEPRGMAICIAGLGLIVSISTRNANRRV